MSDTSNNGNEEERFLRAILHFLDKTVLQVKPEQRRYLHHLISAILESGIAIGYQMKKLPRNKAFMAVRKEQITIHQKCSKQVFPMWTQDDRYKIRTRPMKFLLWWCETCNEVITGREIDVTTRPAENDPEVLST